MALLSQAELEAKIGRSLSSEEQSAFTLINNANQAYVERLIGSSVESDTEATRYYDGGRQFIKIDPCTAITAVKLVDSDQNLVDTYDSSDYVKDPINKTLKTQIIHRYGRFQTGFSNIAVTAVFSIYDDTDVLNIVKNAMLEALASEVVNTDNIVKESIEGYSVEFAKTETKNALDSIRFLFPEII